MHHTTRAPLCFAPLLQDVCMVRARTSKQLALNQANRICDILKATPEHQQL
jgi:hypothetical protein